MQKKIITNDTDALPTLLSINEVANVLSISRDAVKSHIRGGKLKAIKIGHRTIRIRKGDLRQFIDASETGKANGK